MLQIKDIRKQYITGELTQTALDGVSLNLRDNEFVAILGPSGSGKTTLLNVIGGLDRYDSGDLVINGISTKKYKDRDWDSYRNHTIGFVFQSYNLIPHQTVLANVELALTISGISRTERKNRAKKALEEVGLGNQLHKKPNQMSGGQMQRVAIARALVNNPDILLADEPTGALDTETSVQVMELLKEVAKDRLVVMVTHNPELAEEYANRIVRVRDGKILDDSNPYEIDESKLSPPEHKNMGKSSMSFLTALSLSFNNLRTKKGRTLLTSFAGSIGIIGIALILSLSTGVNTYIEDIQRSTMTSYPITIDAQTIDLSSFMSENPRSRYNEEADHSFDAVYSNGRQLEMYSEITTSITENNLTEFKKYLENPESDIHNYVGENGIIYSYDTKFGVYTHDSEGAFVNTDGSTLTDENNKTSSMMSMSPMYSMMKNQSNFEELIPGQNGKLVSSAVTDSYEILYGNWPNAFNEVVLVLDDNNEISTEKLYQLGILPTSEYKELMKKIDKGEEVTIETHKWSYADICNQELYMIPACDTYIENEDGTFTCVADDSAEMEKLFDNAVKLKIVGVIKPSEDSDNDTISSTVAYTKALTDYIIKHTDESPVVKAQQKDKNTNVLNGINFTPKTDSEKIKDVKTYLSNLGVTEKANIFKAMMTASGSSMMSFMSQEQPTVPQTSGQTSVPSQQSSVPQTSGQTSVPSQQSSVPQTSGQTSVPSQQSSVPQTSGQTSVPSQQSSVPQTSGQTSVPSQQMPTDFQSAMTSGQLSEEELSQFLDEYLKDPDDEVMLLMYDNYISSGSYEDNLEAMGVVSLDAPSSISIYADSFEDKDSISTCIEEYNKTVSEENQITYTDYVGLLMSSVTTIVNVISYVLIAFVAVSLVVSSIMIGIITYISVLERTKEIGILRAIGASKRNISQVFNAETFIIGLCSGIIGIGITLLLLIPGNAIIHAIAETDSVNAQLPFVSAIILILISVVLTLIGGLIPSKKAARKDPVTALRTD